MKEQSGHITSKVILGYILLITIAVCSVAYIYNIVEKVAEEDEPDHQARRKVYLVTNTLSLLYESEALGQLVGMPQNEFRHFNRTLNKAHNNMDSLRTLVTDSMQLLKIDTIDILLERKRWNTRRLLETWQEANTERLYTENIEKIIAVRDTIVNEVQVQERVEVKQDTVVVPRKKRGFFKRLADVFSPGKEDTSIVVNTTREIVTDTLVNAYNPTDTIVSVLKSIQDSVAWQRQQLMDQLLERASNLRYNNSVITREINQMLRNIEEEEMEASLERVYKKQVLLRETSHLIAGIAIVSVVIAFLFLFFISRDISRSKYYRMQLEKAKQVAESLLRSREKLMLTISHDILRKIRISSLRRHFGQMLQDVFLFSGTIRSNIVLREEGIPDSEIMEVCRYVNADKFINKLDHGLDEEVRERGNNFSAGQRQLLSFARTIIHKPSVMILDEATANIDTETELLIQDSLEKMRTVGTMLIVAHRLSTIQHADNIIVLSHGKILEQGTHQQLLARHGRYYQLYTLQYHKAQLNAAE